MRKDDINQELSALSFDFFYWFSRFEFALKENNFIKNKDVGSNAEPGWGDFVTSFEGSFVITASSYRLLSLNPLRQKVGQNEELEWKPVGRNNSDSLLCFVVRLLKTVRNNLFHGGKHGAKGWDEPERTKALLICGKDVLDQLVRLAEWESDYTQYY